MIVQSFGSGSSGNAILVREGESSLLVDCGLGGRVLHAGLRDHDLRLGDLAGIVVTHEHADHVRGLDASRRARLPIFATVGTFRGIASGGEANECFGLDDELRIGSLTVRPLAVSHDAQEPCGFAITAAGARVTILTDLGRTDEALTAAIERSDLVVIEANHDVAMLRRGPYPDHLKRRVLGDTGHLSNHDCGVFLATALGTVRASRTIWLAHLSAVNNRPELAVRTVQRALIRLPRRHEVLALPRRAPGPVWQSNQPVLLPTQLSLFGA